MKVAETQGKWETFDRLLIKLTKASQTSVGGSLSMPTAFRHLSVRHTFYSMPHVVLLQVMASV